nr:hypothetical protein [Tanacetum cinerariifolium]
MSDSEDSTVTYTAVSSPFGGLSDIGSSGVDGPPVLPKDPYAYVVAAFQAPPSPDYVTGPEYPPLPKYVPEHVYPEFMPPEDEILTAKEQPLPVVVSPTVNSTGYAPESDSKEDPEEDPADDPADGGDDDDDDDEESSNDDEEDGDVEEEDEHLDPTDSTAVALPAVDHAPSAEETKSFETDESAAIPPTHPAYRVTARMSIRPQTPISFPSDTKIARLMAIPTPPPSPLSLWLSPLPVSSPLPLPTSLTYPLGYRAMMIRLRAEATSTSHPLLLPSTYHLTPPSGTPPLLPIPLPTPSPPLLPLSTDPRADVRESSSAPTIRPAGDSRPDYGFISTLDDEIMRDPQRDVGYGLINSWDEIVETMQGAPATDETELGRIVTDLVATMRRDTDEIYTRHAYAHPALLMEIEARMSWEAWGRVMDACDIVRSKNITLRTQMTEFERQQGPGKGPAQPDAPEEAGSSSYAIVNFNLIVHFTKVAPKRTTRANPVTTTNTTTTTVTNAQLKALIEQGVNAALATHDVDRNTNDDDNHVSRTGTKEVVELTQLFEKMETVFHISNCSVENQIKFSTCTLLGSALTWWNSHVMTIGPYVAYAMTWADLKKKMTNKMFLEESDKIERYVGGLPDMVYGSVVASKTKTMQEAIEMATELMDKKICTFAEH